MVKMPPKNTFSSKIHFIGANSIFRKIVNIFFLINRAIYVAYLPRLVDSSICILYKNLAMYNL